VVDHERLRVAAGEAVLWPAGVPHGAWADHGPMRVFVVELTGADDSWVRGLIDAPAVVRAIGAGGPAERGEGHLAGPLPAPAPDPEAGEPA
jgi:hypothetical protein